jgi:hypothetical protein
MKRFVLILAASVLLTGCATRQISTTPRTAVEQLLLSAAVDHAMAKLDVPELRGRTVFLDLTNLATTDVDYVKVALRARLTEQGVRLTTSDKADLTVEVASGALGMELKTNLIGLPAIPVPQAGLPFPEASLYKTVEQTAIVKLLVFVHEKGKFIASAQYYARSDRDESFILWWRFQRHDDIRSGWERADVKTAARKSDSATKKARGPVGRRKGDAP